MRIGVRKSVRRSRWGVSIVVVALALAATGCGLGGDGEPAAVTYAEAKASGSIKVGFANESPWAYLGPDGELTGYAPTVARAVLGKLGIDKIEGVVTDFDGLIDGVRANNYGFVAAGMFINPKRCQSSAFAIPDYQVGSAFLVPEGNPRKIDRFEDITRENVRIATLGGAVENGYAESAGVPSGLIEPMAKQDDILRAVEAGDVYGAALLDVTSAWLVRQNPEAKLETTPSFQFGDKPAVGTFNFRLDDTEFRDDFNRELRALHESGEWLKLVEPFGLTAANEPDPTSTTEQYCIA
ncbi:ectoine/hydroxyectoine ABC transporter substrate-binding protein EhuB [Nocardia rhizosphaerihabitans]|uniref:Ectoine/hydroxyectoine ABC transporter substrate-binding protein EhuB n=1 Tax=Nocardia rhizosphaerihabitans TaxID=1691570 RepID=A0ABQ2L173_9NOCA|nr:ectoine/hydroxyectoine ABC transporter substrate-binding protein EhuB [Nocardia rhizosphaerihabitans]GGN99319.1 ectoine/hydroxyectoine ABC transporter substrate-binding protein EhuB [Nocardia rhizosphaerihabitans]